MKRYDRVIGIDPDVERSGVAEVQVSTGRIEVTSLSFPALLDYLRLMGERTKSEATVVVVEAGYLNASNWHIGRGGGERRAARIGNNTGRNHETARKIVEMARHYGFEVVEQRPLRKRWRGKDGKITHEELAYVVGGLERRTSQDARDAALLAWTYAGLPVRVKVEEKTTKKARL